MFSLNPFKVKGHDWVMTFMQNYDIRAITQDQYFFLINNYNWFNINLFEVKAMTDVNYAELERAREENETRARNLQRSYKEMYEREQRLLDERTEFAREKREFDVERARGFICSSCAQPIADTLGLLAQPSTGGGGPGTPIVFSGPATPQGSARLGGEPVLAQAEQMPLMASRQLSFQQPGATLGTTGTSSAGGSTLALSRTGSMNMLDCGGVASLRRSAEAISQARTLAHDMENDSALHRWIQDGERVCITYDSSSNRKRVFEYLNYSLPL